MVANLIKLILLLFSSLAQPVLANDIEQKALELAVNESVSATKKYEAAVDRCNKLEKKLDVSLFKGLGIPFEELMHGLYFLSKKARTKCEGQNTLEHYYFAVSRMEHVLDHYGKEINTIYKKVGTIEVLQQSAWRDMELKIKYNEMRPDHRALLESMPELSEPFDPLDQIDEIEAAVNQ